MKATTLSLSAIALLVQLSGCLGDVGSGQGEGDDDVDGSQATAQEDLGAVVPAADSTFVFQPDSSPEPADPDLGPPPGGPGDPCPCKADLRCIEGVCRSKCQRDGLCNVVSGCPADHACIAACPDTDVCLPAVAPGAPCTEETYCPNGHVCSSDGDAYRCVPVCEPAGSACGQQGAGTCQSAGANCNICTSP